MTVSTKRRGFRHDRLFTGDDGRTIPPGGVASGSDNLPVRPLLPGPDNTTSPGDSLGAGYDPGDEWAAKAEASLGSDFWDHGQRASGLRFWTKAEIDALSEARGLGTSPNSAPEKIWRWGKYVKVKRKAKDEG